MMNFKNRHDGFSFAEVMASIFMVGVLLSALLVLQNSVFNRVITHTLSIDRFYPLKNMLFDLTMHPLQGDQKSKEKKNEELGLKIVYEKIPIKETSSLHRFTGLHQEKVTGTWTDRGRERTQELIQYTFIPVEEKNA